jgi:hypothetical protein
VQFVESECEVLPSKERCPYLVVAEMIEQPFTSKSEEIYTQGAYVRVYMYVCVRLYRRPDDRSSSGECYKREETIFLTPLSQGSRKGYQTIGGLQQLSYLGPRTFAPFILFCLYRASHRRDSRGHHQRTDSAPRQLKDEY